MTALVAAFSIAILAAAPALSADDAGARALFKRGERAYADGDFEAALESYQAAYDAVALPGFLFNIAQCHRRLQQPERATFFYERYLELAPDGPNHDVAAHLLAEQRALVTPKEPAPSIVAPAPLAPALAPSVQLEQLPVARLKTAPPATPGTRSTWWLWTGAAALVVAGGIATAFSLKREGPLPQASLGSIDRR